MDFYPTRTRGGLSAREARDVAAGNMPAIARPQDKADWAVIYLSRSPDFDGQEPFPLKRAEIKALEEWYVGTKYANLTHFAAERGLEIETYMKNLLDMLNDTEGPKSREDYKKLLDDAAVKRAAWAEVRRL